MVLQRNSKLMLLNCMFDNMCNSFVVDNFIHSPLELTRVTFILELREIVSPSSMQLDI